MPLALIVTEAGVFNSQQRPKATDRQTEKTAGSRQKAIQGPIDAHRRTDKDVTAAAAAVDG